MFACFLVYVGLPEYVCMRAGMCIHTCVSVCVCVWGSARIMPMVRFHLEVVLHGSVLTEESLSSVCQTVRDRQQRERRKTRQGKKESKILREEKRGEEQTNSQFPRQRLKLVLG